MKLNFNLLGHTSKNTYLMNNILSGRYSYINNLQINDGILSGGMVCDYFSFNKKYLKTYRTNSINKQFTSVFINDNGIISCSHCALKM